MSDQIIPSEQIRGPQDKSGAPGTVFLKLEDAVRWARTKSMWPLLFGLACCAIEMMDTFASYFDLARFGMEVYRASPRQADLMIVSGRVSRKMAAVVRQLYDQMPDPKWVIAMGDCASSGGVYNNYAILQGVDEIIPVDVYVSGCPPRPEALMDGILRLHKKIETQEPRGQIKIEGFGLRG
ncbi:MAG: NADH-quinone oxidoreductase subunit B family protein [Anaerolineae bacterium]